MAPRLDFSGWWAKDKRKGTPVVVTMENPNYSVLEIDGPDTEAFPSMDKDRGKNAKQFTWVLLLKAHYAVGCISSVAAMLWALPGVVKRRLVFRQAAATQSDDPDKGHLMLRFIRGFLLFSLVALAFELVAYRNGWHFKKPNLRLPQSLHILEATEIQGWMHSAYLSWLSFRADYIAYPIQLLSYMCIILFVIQSADRLILCLGCFWIKFKKIKPRGESDPFNSGSEYIYPMVLVQIPMYRLLIQVLDDSDDETIQLLISTEVSKWSQRGVNIVYRHRLVRTGYKAGNLKSAMSCDYVKDYEFVAIFDADFQPNPDFLKLTIPHFKVNGVFWNFFGFNGTAGVWRIKALEDSGGWLERTTVEDMDIAVRAHLHEAELPVWVICYVPVIMSFLNILPALRSFPFIVPYLLFENTMSVTKFNAMVSGLFKLGSSYEWVVTKKAGRSSESDLLTAAEREAKIVSLPLFHKGASVSELSELNRLKEQHEKAPSPAKKANKIYKKELALSLLLLTAAARSLLSAQGIHFYFLLFQGMSFLLVGLDLIGEQMS
ncbi:hypothetical protein B296_00057197 [Ensete ventricosum]|uniref:Glycosyltransferase 2-like domain-containing protein n=1 Tax=Ensete ventricosum TaxID=4639 RepID=A0A426XS74_ENSVE|nr:hypothetical protein B296_00057197 [Ensete ventricosum]